MAKTRDVVPELRAFNKVFEELSYSYDYARVFSDFLDYCIECFTPPGFKSESTVKRLKEFYEEKYELFPKLFFEIVHVMDNTVGNGKKEWYDPFGDYYMCLTPPSKHKTSGQFFSPTGVSEVLSDLVTRSLSKTERDSVRVLDPACGSGRMLISFHAANPGNYVFGQDLDELCAKMTAINLVMHGAEGEVAQMNSLTNEWFKGWRVNPLIRSVGFPHLIEISENEQSFVGGETKKNNDEIQGESKTNMTSSSKSKEGIPGSQLSFF